MGNYQSKRKEYLDITKGIGILLVVLGHCPLVFNPLKQWIYAFHMPLFFFVAGMVWNKDSHEKRGFFTGEFLADKIKRLIIPCFIWGVLYMLLDMVMNHSFSPKLIAYLIYGSQAGFQHAGSLTSLWFLPCMFLSVCAFEIIQKLLVKAKHGALALFFISVLCACTGLFLPRLSNGYPWSADVAFLAVAFIIWGYMAASWIEKAANKKTLWAIIMMLLLLAVSLTYVFNLPYVSINNVDLAGRYFGNRALYLLNATGGSTFVLFLGIVLCRNKQIAVFISDLGRKTIPILLIHKPLVRALNRIGDTIGVPTAVTVIVSAAVAIGFSLIIYMLVKKILPIAFGESGVK